MERPLFQPVGTPVLQLDTPVLVVDLTVLEHNIETVHAFFRQRASKVRPYVASHYCPAIGRKQLAVPGTVGGISVATLGEAEVFATHGFSDIFIANQIVTPAKISRLCALARQVTITVVVDHVHNVQALSAAAMTHSTTLQVVVESRTHADRGGTAPGEPVIELARAVCQAPHLDFVGLSTEVEPSLTAAAEKPAAPLHELLQPVIDTRDRLRKAGIGVRVVSVGDTSTYESAAALDGVTEVRAGTYALTDARYAEHCPTLRPAARVLTTITSRPEPGTAITDTGQKAIGIGVGLPLVADIPGVTVTGLSAEHCRLQLDHEADGKVALGDKIWLTPWDIGTCANLYDNIYAVRDNVLEAVWPVAARGQYR